jgi:hypothetical protein
MSAFLPAFAKLRQPVGELYPLEPTARSRVVERRHSVGLVEAAGGHVDLVARAVELEGELRAAFRALRVPFPLDLKRVGSPPISRNCERRTLNHATKGAPVVRRQMEQWQFVWLNGAPSAS